MKYPAPAAGQMWEWIPLEEIFVVLSPPINRIYPDGYTSDNTECSAYNLTSGSMDTIVFSPKNMRRWRFLA